MVTVPKVDFGEIEPDELKEVPEIPDEENPPAAPVISPYDQWKITGDPSDLNKVVNSLDGKINSHLHRYGLGSDPLAKGQARVYAAKAVKTYDPDSGASLHTWLDRSMQQLSRFKRTRATAIKVPERVQLDNYTLSRAQADFEEEHQREPTLEELADNAGMTVKRLNQVRSTFRKMTSEAPHDGNLSGGGFAPDHMSEALDVIYGEADKLDKQIIEMKTGYGGRHQPMSPKDIAIRLNISPVVLTRRSARLMAKMEDTLDTLEN